MRSTADTVNITMHGETSPGVDPALTRELELLAQEAEAHWSGSFLIEPRVFVAYLSARLASSVQDVAAGRNHAADLYLACGCALGIPEAVQIFEATFNSEIATTLHRMHLQPSSVDEVRQMTWEKLLVGSPGRSPRIAEYAGRGTLRGWTRVVVTRTALNALRSQKREARLEEALLDPATDAWNPELECLRNRFGAALDLALERAMGSLTPDERVLLRQRFVDGVTSEQLARLHRRHRVTMARRINGILRALRARTEALLASEVGCGHSTAVSIVNMGVSHAHLSIRRWLETQRLPALVRPTAGEQIAQRGDQRR